MYNLHQEKKVTEIEFGKQKNSNVSVFSVELKSEGGDDGVVYQLVVLRGNYSKASLSTETRWVIAVAEFRE